jgi:hypothetical protein
MDVGLGLYLAVGARTVIDKRGEPALRLEGRTASIRQLHTGRNPRSAAKRAFDAMMTMKKIDIAAIEAALRG